MNRNPDPENGNASDSGASDKDLERRFGDLGRELEDKRNERYRKSSKPRKASGNYSDAIKISSEFVAGIAVGGFIGWAVDKWLGISPLGLIFFLMLGFAAGVLNVIRSTSKSPTDGSNEGN